MLFAFMVSAQTLMHTDTLTTVDGETIMYKWYHEDFGDSDGESSQEFTLTSLIGLVKVYQTADTTYESVMTHYKRTLREVDSLKNPYGSNYFMAPFVRNYIYSTDENMKRTLSLYWILNEEKRLLE